MRIILLPGHSKRRDGSVVCAGPYKGKGEFALAGLYLEQLGRCLAELGYDVVQTCRADAGGTSPMYSALAANAAGGDIALEFHFNAADSVTTSGTEVLYWGNSARGKLTANMLSTRVAKLLGLRNRGAKPVWGPADRGYLAFRRSRMPFFMVEPCFAGSNRGDAEKLGEAIKEGWWPKAVAGAIDEVLSQVYNKSN